MQPNHSSNNSSLEKYLSKGIASEENGNIDDSLHSYHQAISLNKAAPLAYLFYGCALHQAGRTEAAAEVLSLGCDLAESILYWWQDNECPEIIRRKSFQGSKILRDFLTSQHICATTNSSQRIKESLWTRTHNQKFRFPVPNQQPQMFMIPELRAEPWHQYENASWLQDWKAQTNIILTEFETAIQTQATAARPYLSDTIIPEESFSHLNNSMNWGAIDLYKNSQEIDTNTKLMPTLKSLLLNSPTYNRNGSPVEAFISILKADKKIPPHYGQSNHCLTVHFPIYIPEGDCSIRVGNTSKNWEIGEFLIFDDSFNHEATNLTKNDRAVIIFSIWHPDLTSAERKDILNAFDVRDRWMSSRKIPEL